MKSLDTKDFFTLIKTSSPIEMNQNCIRLMILKPNPSTCYKRQENLRRSPKSSTNSN